jgi:hypothetical protein
MVATLTGLGLGLAGLVAGGLVLVSAQGDVTANYVLGTPLLNAFGIGIPALVLGPLGYFLARSVQARMGATAVIGIAATVIGAASTLLWIVIMLLGYFGPPPAQ